MAEKTNEYRFVLTGSYTPDTIPQARLAEYLAALADLYGREDVLHFVGVEPSSLAVRSVAEPEAEDDVQERLESATDEGGQADAKQAYERVTKLAMEDRATSAWIERRGATVLTFPMGQRQEEAVVYGPFWQRGHLTGTVILLGGKSDPVSVKIQVKEKTITCKAKRETAKELRDYIWGAPVRLEGNGRWTRDAEGTWKLLEFHISTFDPIEEESLTTTVTRLRAIEGKWKNRPDPLAELDAIRHGDDGDR